MIKQGTVWFFFVLIGGFVWLVPVLFVWLLMGG